MGYPGTQESLSRTVVVLASCPYQVLLAWLLHTVSKMGSFSVILLSVETLKDTPSARCCRLEVSTATCGVMGAAMSLFGIKSRSEDMESERAGDATREQFEEEWGSLLLGSVGTIGWRLG